MEIRTIKNYMNENKLSTIISNYGNNNKFKVKGN